MMNNKIAFVVVRYGKEINGGAELHCRMLAERLSGKYQVEILTTCVKNYVTGKNEFPTGTEVIDGIKVRRFPTSPEPLKHHRYSHRITRTQKFRKFLCRKHLLNPISRIFPTWNIFKNSGEAVLKSGVFYSPDLFNYIKLHQQEYSAFIAFTLDFPTTYYTALYVPEKTIIIPLLHPTDTAFSPLATYTMTHSSYIAFNTTAEEKLGEDIFGPRMSKHGIVSVSFERSNPASWSETKTKYKLPEHYLLYVGRIDADKTTDVFTYFSAYKREYPTSSLTLVLMGGLYMKPIISSDIIYTGFVSDEEKTTIIQHADIVINPSRFESLSLILLEAFHEKKAMLVNGHCNVLKEHSQKSGGAAFTYFGMTDFIQKLHKLESSESLRKDMGEKGFVYVTKNYNWNTIMKRLTSCIENVIRANNSSI